MRLQSLIADTGIGKVTLSVRALGTPINLVANKTTKILGYYTSTKSETVDLYQDGDECETGQGTGYITTEVAYQCDARGQDTLIRAKMIDACTYRIRVATSRPELCACEGGLPFMAMVLTIVSAERAHSLAHISLPFTPSAGLKSLQVNTGVSFENTAAEIDTALRKYRLTQADLMPQAETMAKCSLACQSLASKVSSKQLCSAWAFSLDLSRVPPSSQCLLLVPPPSGGGFVGVKWPVMRSGSILGTMDGKPVALGGELLKALTLSWATQA